MAGPDRAAEEKSFNQFVLVQRYILTAVTGIGFLALTWSTVVLLGGFVSSLAKKDFWCLTAISMIQASRILNDWEEGLVMNFLGLALSLLDKAEENSSFFVPALPFLLVLTILLLVLEIIYIFGSVICAALSLWRMIQRDYGNMGGDGTKTNLMPALDVFYSLVICQGALFFLWLANAFTAQSHVVQLCQAWKFPKEWGSMSVTGYLNDTRLKCRQDPKSIEDTGLIVYAVNLLDSNLPLEYLSGARMLDMFIKQGVDLKSLLLPSRPKIQKLIDTLRWTSWIREIRECAARIVAHLASDIDLSQYPGAIRCISCLLDTTLPYWINQQGANHQSTQSYLEQPTAGDEGMISHERKLDQQGEKKGKNQEGGDQQGARDSFIDDRGDGWNELILQGLTILERLASDQHNCSDICSTPGLLPKIIALICSDTLIQDIDEREWTDVVTGSCKLLHMLICAPEWLSRRLPLEISSNKQAVRNLERILDHGNEDLRMIAIQILTKLAFDLSVNLATETKENLIVKQMQIFLTADKGEGEPITQFMTTEKLIITAGRTLALLSKTETICVLMMAKKNELVGHLSEILDFKNYMIYRTIAAEILENLCTHCTLDKECVKKTLLPMVLKQVPTCKRELPTEASRSDTSVPRHDEENQEGTQIENDEENQPPRHSSQTKTDDKENKDQTAILGLQEALLSLTLVTCDKLIIADDTDGELAVKLKAIVEENCQCTAASLRIVRLCGQIAVSMMRHSKRTAHFKAQKFTESLSKASEIMSNLDNRMTFAEADCGANKIVKPLLSDLVKEALELVA